MSTHWFDEAMNLPGATLDNAVDPDVIGAYGLEPDTEDTTPSLPPRTPRSACDPIEPRSAA